MYPVADFYPGAHGPSLSAKECKRRRHMLSVLTPERFGTGTPRRPRLDHAKPHYTSEAVAAIDSVIARLQQTMCKECTALELGDAHMNAMRDFNDFYGGPNTEGHPANQSLRSLKRSSDRFPCCKSMYNAASPPMYSPKSGRRIRPESDDLQTRVGFTRYNGEHFLEIKTGAGKRLALLRMAHCEITKILHEMTLTRA